MVVGVVVVVFCDNKATQAGIGIWDLGFGNLGFGIWEFGIWLGCGNIQILFETQKNLDEGSPIFNLGYEGGIAANPFFDIDTDNDLESQE